MHRCGLTSARRAGISHFGSENYGKAIRGGGGGKSYGLRGISSRGFPQDQRRCCASNSPERAPASSGKNSRGSLEQEEVPQLAISLQRDRSVVIGTPPSSRGDNSRLNPEDFVLVWKKKESVRIVEIVVRNHIFSTVNVTWNCLFIFEILRSA